MAFRPLWTPPDVSTLAPGDSTYPTPLCYRRLRNPPGVLPRARRSRRDRPVRGLDQAGALPVGYLLHEIQAVIQVPRPPRATCCATRTAPRSPSSALRRTSRRACSTRSESFDGERGREDGWRGVRGQITYSLLYKSRATPAAHDGRVYKNVYSYLLLDYSRVQKRVFVNAVVKGAVKTTNTRKRSELLASC